VGDRHPIFHRQGQLKEALSFSKNPGNHLIGDSVIGDV
jgi:hypothetical protein